MKNIFFLLIAVLLTASSGFAQTKGSIKARIIEAKDTKSYIPGATVSIQRLPDSTIVGYTISDDLGYFEYKGLAEGNFRLLVKMVGSNTLRKEFSISAATPNVNLGDLGLEPESIEGIVIKGEVAPVLIKQDTVEFNAAAFKTKPNASTEDLLKKLPGVEVAKDGTIKAQGETVRRILVDGKPFFSDDPKVASKNLPANMVDKVQMIDQLSEQSQFTGVDDGNREKVLNITTKKDMKKGTFGRAMAGAGTDNRYESNLSLNRFKNERQISIIGSANNINVQNFSLNNSFGGGGGGGNFQRLAGAFGANTGNNAGGITTVWSLGANFNDQFKNGVRLSGNYLFNNSEYVVSQNTKRQNILANNTTFFTASNNRNTTNTNNHRLNFRVDYDLDSLTSVRIVPSFLFSKSKYNNNTLSNTQSDELRPLNDATTSNLSDNDLVNYATQMLVRRRFKKRGRSLSFNGNITGSFQNNNTFNNNLNRFYTNSVVTSTQDIRQRSVQAVDRMGFQGTFSYVTPISRKRSLDFNYTLNANANPNNTVVDDFDVNSQEYIVPNIQLTNNFDNKYTSNRFGVNLVTNKLKYSYILGVATQYASQNNSNLTQNTAINREFVNYFPRAQFRYNFGKNRRLRIDYNGSTNQPTALQLQPVIDNSNPLNVTQGNPDLRQEVNNSIRANFISFNMTKFSSLFAFVSVTNTANKIVNNTNITPSGTQFTSYRNTNGIWNATAFAGTGIPLKGNSLMLNLTTNAIWTKNRSFINNAANITDNYTLGQGARITWNYKEKLDFNLSGNINYVVANYSLQPQNNIDYFTNTAVADITYTFNNGIVLGTELDYFANVGLAAGFAQNYTIWNASIAKQIFKDKRGEIKLRMFDGFRQNIGITRTVSDTYIQDVSNVVLQRYYMLSFTYNINRMAAARNEQNQMDRRFGR